MPDHLTKREVEEILRIHEGSSLEYVNKKIIPLARQHLEAMELHERWELGLTEEYVAARRELVRQWKGTNG
jgi:hypothetical protein